MRDQYDFIIIGAGILGISIAGRLAAKNKRVLVVEQSDIAGGASGGNLGQISLMDRFEDWHLEMTLESLDYYKNLNRTQNIGYRQHGGSILLLNRKQLRRAEQVAEMQAKRGVKMDILSKSESKSIEPYLKKEDLLALAYCPEEGSLDPLKLTYYLTEQAQRFGAEIHCSERIIGFKTDCNRIKGVHSTENYYTADIVINCAGAWSSDIAKLLNEQIPVRNHRGTAFVTSPMPKLLHTSLVGGGFLMEESNGTGSDLRIGTALCQHDNGSIILGQATEVAEVDNRDVTLSGLSQTAHNILSYFPVLEHVDIIRSWAVATSYSTDGKPVLGFSHLWENFFTAAGFKGAFSTAPAVARIAESMLLQGERYIEEIEPRGGIGVVRNEY